MFSPPNYPPVTAWFARLDAAWRRTPADERTRQCEEIEQHLDGLVMTRVAQGQPLEDAWEAALAQFGDPTQIGRKMYYEWQQGRTGFRTDMKAILFGFCLQWLLAFATQPLTDRWFSRFFNPGDSLYTHGHGLIGIALVVSMIIHLGGNILICVAIVRKYPMQALKATLYSHFLVMLVGWSWIIAYEIRYNPSHSVPYVQWGMFTHALWKLPVWYAVYMIVAYLASVTKRGWYRPTLADFKITLPRRRFKIAR